MRKLKYIILGLCFSLLANSQTTYYVSNTGSDVAAGTSTGTAWQTVSKVNSTTFVPGDSILFEAGNIWREILVITDDGTSGNFITYSRYGEGTNPKFLGSEVATDWTEVATNIWLTGTALTDFSTYNGGYPEQSYPGRAYFHRGDSVIWADFAGWDAGFSGLDEDFEYMVNNADDNHYFYATSNPGLLYDSIEVTQRSYCAMFPSNPADYIIINGLDFKYSRLDGFFSGYPAEPATDLVFKNCSIQYIGTRGSDHAYGLGVWHSNMLIEDCFITDAGRRGISLATYDLGGSHGGRIISNVIVRNNTFKRGWHTTGMDLESGELTEADADTIRQIYYYNNIHDDSELNQATDGIYNDPSGWTRSSNQSFWQTYMWSASTDIYIVGNLFIGATARAINFAGCDSMYVWNNTITGHNETIWPYKGNDGSFSVGGSRAKVDVLNNILHDNIYNSSAEEYGIHNWDDSASFYNKDYNIYSYVEADRSTSYVVSYYRVDGNYYYGRSDAGWSLYRAANPTWDVNSAIDSIEFTDVPNHDFSLKPTSPGVDEGTSIPLITCTDPFGVIDTVGKYDLNGNVRSLSTPNIGAYEDQDIDSTATNITSFSIPSQISSTITVADSSIAVTVAYGYDVSSVIGTWTLSTLASSVPTSGTSQDYTTPLTIDITANKGNNQEWTVTVTVQAAPPSAPSIYNVKRVKFGSRRVINGKFINFSK